MSKRRALMREMARTRHAWNEYVKEIALAEGVPDSYRPVIMFLHHHPGFSQRSVAEFVGVTTSAINQIVKSMLEDSYLRKETDPSDKRSSKLYLTEKGTAVALRLHEKLGEADDAITALIGAQREEELMDLLEQLTDFIRRELRQC